MLLIASDLHGSYSAALMLEKRIEELKPDLIILLGDLLYHGPRNDLPDKYNPRKVIEILSKFKDRIIAVRGNCDAEVDQMVLPFSIMNRASVVFYNGYKLFLSHGHRDDEIKEGFDAEVFISGHTHIPVLERIDNRIMVNPGSLSIPKGGSDKSYAIWDDNAIKLCSLETGKEYKSITLHVKI